jgi:putative hydrolase of the HAD superfamily
VTPKLKMGSLFRDIMMKFSSDDLSNSILDSDRTLIFDLDNTIINEIDYLTCVYKEISERYLHLESSVGLNWFLKEFQSSGRTEIFQKFIEKFSLSTVTVGELVCHLRFNDISEPILPFTWFVDYCAKFEANQIPIRIITNGNIDQQKNKIEITAFPHNVMLEVIYASNYGGKPAPESFYELKDHEKFIKPIYIGDSKVDFEFARKVGIDFLNSNFLCKL